MTLPATIRGVANWRGTSSIPGTVTLRRAGRLITQGTDNIELTFTSDTPWQLTAEVNAPECYMEYCL